LPQREYIEFDLFKSTLELAEKNIKDETTKARVLIGFIILYLTGMSCFNLEVLTKKYFLELLNDAHIPLIKRGPKHQPIDIGRQGQTYLNKYRYYFEILLHNKDQMDHLLFSSKTDFYKPYHRSNLNKQLNKILTREGNSLTIQKYFKTHSFRVTYVNDSLKSGIPIEKVKENLGHKSLITTDIY
jgi:site-specific recombinase XerD